MLSVKVPNIRRALSKCRVFFNLVVVLVRIEVGSNICVGDVHDGSMT
jgi:hypothetical protein